MSTALVVYATKTGCTKGIAEAIGLALEAKGFSVAVAAADTRPDPGGYDAVLVGSGIRAGNWHQSAKDYVTSYADVLKSRPVAFFTACLTMANTPEKADEVRAYTDALIAQSGVRPADIGLFAGMNVPKAFSFPERLIMKAMKAPEGDFRDLDAARSWATGVADRLLPGA